MTPHVEVIESLTSTNDLESGFSFRAWDYAHVSAMLQVDATLTYTCLNTLDRQSMNDLPAA